MIAKPVIRFAKASKTIGSALSCRLVQWTGKHHLPIHPHHLVQAEELWFLKHLRKADVVLDIGCHNGQHTLKAARRAHSVSGLDYDERFLAHARLTAKREGVKNVSFQFGSAEKAFPFPDKHFDVVLFLDVLEHLNQRQVSLKEVGRVIKPSGRLFVSVPKRDTTWKTIQARYGMFYFSDPDHKIEYSRNEITRELAKADFTIVSCDPIVFDTWAGGLIDIVGGINLGWYKKTQAWRRQKAIKNPDESIGFYIVAKPSNRHVTQ